MKLKEKVSIKDIDAAPFNPAIRTSPSSLALKDLTESLKNEGQKVPVHLIKTGSRYATVDGHRRLAAYKILGRETIDAVVHPLPHGTELIVEQARLFAIISGEVRNMSALHWMEFWMKCDGKAPEIHMPRSVVRDINRCVELIGHEGLELMLRRHISPSIVQWSTKLRNAIMQYSETPASKKKSAYRYPTAARCLQWLVTHDGAPHAVKALATIHSKSICQKVVARIFANKSLTVAELIPKPKLKNG